MSLWWSKIFLFVLHLLYNTKLVSAQTCEIKGQVFRAGQELGENFLPNNRCGSEFPCFCNPSLPEQIECPYCRFPSMGGELVCSRPGESVTYRDQEGHDQTCSCQARRSNPNEPIPSCASRSSALFPDPDVSRTHTCAIGLPDGTSKVYTRGESLDNFRENRCGSEFPCFCNPSKRGQIECPYCRFASMGGDLVCARQGESVNYRDLEGRDQTCSCKTPNDPNAEPVANCFESGSLDFFSADESRTDTCTIELPDGTTKTYNEGDSLGNFRENRCGSEFPCFCKPSVEGQIECPYCRFVSMDSGLVCARAGESVTYQDLEGVDRTCSCEIPDNPNNNPIASCIDVPNPSEVTDVTQLDVCTLELESGQSLTFANGESYGNYLTTRCASSEEFPCFCSPASYNQMECPYCGFSSGDGSLYCAKDKETISFADGGVTRTCSCEIPDDPFQSPILSCDEGGLPSTNAPVVPLPTSNDCIFTKPNGEIVTIENGGSFGNLIEGVCGPAEEWPAFCNMDLGNTISRQSNNAEYPYCIFQNTASGDPVCVRSNEQVTYKDENGVALTCSCLYLSATLGGAQATCQKVENPVPPPSQEPTVAPGLRSTPQPQGTSSAFVASWTMGIPWIMFMTFNLII